MRRDPPHQILHMLASGFSLHVLARSLSHLHAPPVCLSNAPIPSFLSRRVLYLKLPHTVALFGLSFSQRKNNKHLDCLLFFSLPFRSFLLFLPLFFPPLPFHLPSFTALLSLTPPVSLNNLNVASPHTCCFFFYSAVWASRWLVWTHQFFREEVLLQLQDRGVSVGETQRVAGEVLNAHAFNPRLKHTLCLIIH